MAVVITSGNAFGGFQATTIPPNFNGLNPTGAGLNQKKNENGTLFAVAALIGRIGRTGRIGGTPVDLSSHIHYNQKSQSALGSF